MSNIQFFTKITEESIAPPLQIACGSQAVQRTVVRSRSNQDLLKAIRCSITNPTELDNRPDHTHWFRPIQTGFSLKLPADTMLIWCRFRAVISPLSNKDESVSVVTFHPQEIRRPTSFRDNLLLGENGLERSVAGGKDRPDQIVNFDSLLSGYKNGQNVHWDFSPANGTPSSGSNRLLIAVGTTDYYPLQITTSLQLTLYSQETGEISLELQPEKRNVR